MNQSYERHHIPGLQKDYHFLTFKNKVLSTCFTMLWQIASSQITDIIRIFLLAQTSPLEIVGVS